MVAGKVKAVMGFQRSPGAPKLDLPRRPSSSPPSATPSSNKAKSAATVFSRPFGVYFPRASAQVQPRPPDAGELLKLVGDLQEKESRLRIEHNLVRETAAIVPFLERELASKNDELGRCKKRIESLEQGTRMRDEKVRALEAEIAELKNRRTTAAVAEIDECSSSASQRFQGLIDASARSNLLRNLRKVAKSTDIVTTQQNGDQKKEAEIIEKRDDVFELLRCPRIPKPPPLPSAPPSRSYSAVGDRRVTPAAPPPPPPPPPKGLNSAATCVRRVPEVVEFYHSLMRRDSKREPGGGVTDLPSNTRNMIGEIENRSAHLLAIKTDVETQGDFIRSLIKEVNSAAFTNIEDLVAFVKWLDDELSYLVDERAVLKHFDWPEHKADAMREAAFGYRDLKKLELEASTFRDDRRQHCSPALKKMQALLEKLEHGVYNLSRAREGAMKKYKGFEIPWEWMLDSGFVSQIKLASVKLAMKYMRRVSSELESVAGGEEEELMLQGVRFAFRVHQFAGGFDVETMRAFQELRDKARSLQSHKQTQH